jgi:hypothetical protein
MRTLRSWAVRLLSLFRRRQLEERLEEELGFHLEMQAGEHEAHGMSPEAARRAARAAVFSPRAAPPTPRRWRRCGTSRQREVPL